MLTAAKLYAIYMYSMQTSDKKLLSRNRQKLRRMHEKVRKLLDVVMDHQPITKGSVYEMRRKCGKKGCRCTEGQLHSSMVISWSEDGKNKLRTIPKDQFERLRKQTERYQALRRARARIVKLQKELIAIIDAIEALRSIEM